MDIEVSTAPGPAHAGQLRWQGETYQCALGRAGTVDIKREGDGATPRGRFSLREVLFRADRLDRPKTLLPVRPLRPTDGWCDAPTDPNYNCAVTHPYPASAEYLWRDEDVYDLIIILGYNLDPITPGAGSAIFCHVATAEFSATDGCIALHCQVLLKILATSTPDTYMEIT